MRSFTSNHLPALVWSTLTTFMLLTPGDSLPSVGGRLGELAGPWLDKAVHVVLFFVLVRLVARSLGALGRVRRPYLAAVVAAICLGLVLELAQIPIGGRGWEVWDLVANAVGALAGAWLRPGSRAEGEPSDRASIRRHRKRGSQAP